MHRSVIVACRTFFRLRYRRLPDLPIVACRTIFKWPYQSFPLVINEKVMFCRASYKGYSYKGYLLSKGAGIARLPERKFLNSFYPAVSHRISEAAMQREKLLAFPQQQCAEGVSWVRAVRGPLGVP